MPVSTSFTGLISVLRSARTGACSPVKTPVRNCAARSKICTSPSVSAVWRERYLKDFVAGDKSKSAQRLATPGTQMNWKDAYMMAVQQNPLLQVSYLHPHTRSSDTALT